MKTKNVINRIPTDIEEFQDFINLTDDLQKEIDKIGYTIHPRDKNGVRDYSDKENDVIVINEPMYKRFDWKEEESQQWSRFRNEYNIIYKQYYADTDNKQLIQEAEQLIKRTIDYDHQQQLIQRISESWHATYMHQELFNIKQDELEYETPLRTISLKYEKGQPLTKLENTFIKKYIELHEHSFKTLERIKKFRNDMVELQSKLPPLWQQLPVLKDQADKAANIICMPPPHFKGMWSEVVSFTIPTPEQNQQNVDEFNNHFALFYKELMDMHGKSDVLFKEYEWVLEICNGENDKFSEKLWKEVEDLKSKVFQTGTTGSIDIGSIDEDFDGFLDIGWTQVTEASAEGDKDWDKFANEQQPLYDVYSATVNFINERNNASNEEDDTEAIDVSAPQNDDDADDLRTETIKKYQADLDNTTNTYFDTQDWHIILDAFAAKHDNKNIDIAMERALTQHPDNAVMLTRYSHLEADKHNYQKALELIKQAEEQGPEHHPNLPYGKANIYCQLHTPDLAIPIYKKLAADARMEMTWWRTHSLDRLIDIYDAKKEYEQCIKLSKEALKERKEDETLTSNLALYFSNNKQDDEAEKLLIEFIKNHPESAECNERLGTIYVDLKQFEKAIECFDIAYQLDKQENYGALNLKGKALMELKKYAEAIVCFEVCILHFKLTPDYHISAAQCYTEMKLEQQATYHYRKALSLDPDSKLAMDALKVFRNELN